MRRSPFLALCGILATFGVALGHPDPVEDAAYAAMEQALAEREAPLSAADQARADALAALKGAELKDALLALEADAAVPADVRERLLFDAVTKLASAMEFPPEPAIREVLDHFADYRSIVTYAEPACRNEVTKPLYPVSAAAQGGLDAIQRAEGKVAGGTLWGGTSDEFLDALRALENAEGPFAEGMFDAGSHHVYWKDRVRMLELPGVDMSNPNITRYAVMESKRATLDALHSRILREGDERVVLGAIAEDAFDARTLMANSSLPGRESAITLALGRMLNSNLMIAPFLLSQLPGPNGSSAAQAIAEAHDPDLTAKVIAAIATETEPRALARMALALRLEGGDAAKAALAEFVKRTDVPAELRREAVQ